MVLTSLFLIFINYFTIKTLSALRAYSNGESHYSKAQKNATRYLIMYVYSENPAHWEEFKKELNVIEGDRVARTGMANGGDTDDIRENLLAGRNHIEDVDNMMWLFRNFRHVPFMKKAIKTWEEADKLVGEKYAYALEIREKVYRGSLPQGQKQQLVERINEFTIGINEKENEFSAILGEASRTLNGYLFYFNIFMILMIVGSGSFLTMSMISSLDEKNRDLIITNNELDKFVYSASHDLRAPITSMKGLIEISKLEEDDKKKQQYLNLMMDTLNRQDHFIREIIDFSRNKRSLLKIQEIDLKKIIESSIQQHRYMDGADQITFGTDIRIEKLYNDTLRVEIILNNLISNAIKYSDKRKKDQFVNVITDSEGDSCIIEVEDNGIGISAEDQKLIFDMFFASEHNSMNSGLGLYITKETINKLGGTIEVESERNVGTTFRVSLPNRV